METLYVKLRIQQICILYRGVASMRETNSLACAVKEEKHLNTASGARQTKPYKKMLLNLGSVRSISKRKSSPDFTKSVTFSTLFYVNLVPFYYSPLVLCLFI